MAGILPATLPDKDSCIHQGRIYPETSEVCGHEICIICRQGEWVEMSPWPRGSKSG